MKRRDLIIGAAAAAAVATPIAKAVAAVPPSKAVSYKTVKYVGTYSAKINEMVSFGYRGQNFKFDLPASFMREIEKYYSFDDVYELAESMDKKVDNNKYAEYGGIYCVGKYENGRGLFVNKHGHVELHLTDPDANGVPKTKVWDQANWPREENEDVGTDSGGEGPLREA